MFDKSMSLTYLKKRLKHNESEPV